MEIESFLTQASEFVLVAAAAEEFVVVAAAVAAAIVVAVAAVVQFGVAAVALLEEQHAGCWWVSVVVEVAVALVGCGRGFFRWLTLRSPVE